MGLQALLSYAQMFYFFYRSLRDTTQHFNPKCLQGIKQLCARDVPCLPGCLPPGSLGSMAATALSSWLSTLIGRALAFPGLNNGSSVPLAWPPAERDTH